MNEPRPLWVIEDMHYAAARSLRLLLADDVHASARGRSRRGCKQDCYKKKSSRGRIEGGDFVGRRLVLSQNGHSRKLWCNNYDQKTVKWIDDEGMKR